MNLVPIFRKRCLVCVGKAWFLPWRFLQCFHLLFADFDLLIQIQYPNRSIIAPYVMFTCAPDPTRAWSDSPIGMSIEISKNHHAIIINISNVLQCSLLLSTKPYTTHLTWYRLSTVTGWAIEPRTAPKTYHPLRPCRILHNNLNRWMASNAYRACCLVITGRESSRLSYFRTYLVTAYSGTVR